LYTWDNTGNPQPNIENWVKNFGTNTVTLDNLTPGELRIIETGTAGEDIAISDGANRVRESATAGSGGTDLTGLDFLEFDIGHSGVGNIGVQFYLQGGLGFTYNTLANLNVTPGVNTYQVPLAAVPADQLLYVRTLGFQAFDHIAEGNVTWTLREVRSGGVPLDSRALITHAAGTGDGGLQGAIANFDLPAIQGNNGGQNQTGLSWNPAGTGSLQWTDLGGQQGAAIGWGNGTAWNGNTFNNREFDLSNYSQMIVRISATDPLNGGGTVGMNAYIQSNNFSFVSVEGGAGRNLPIDGQFHDLVWNFSGLANSNAIDLVGINLFGHAQNLVMNVDSITFVPEPATLTLIGIAIVAGLCWERRKQQA
jgi:hypothetical protein